MFTPLFIAGLVLLLAGLFVGRYLAERSMKLLSPDEKLKLLDSFSRLRVFGSLPMLIVFFSFFGIGYLPQSLMWPAYFAAWALVAAYFIVIHIYVFRKMREFGINAEFLSAHNKARWVQYGGWIAFFSLNTLSSFV
jgi:uncharacterized membrane protein (DUF485 family)